MLDESNQIPCKISPSVRLKVGEDSTLFNSGCSVIEINFPATKGCAIGYIKFKNNYVASLSIRVKFKDEEKGCHIWKTLLRDYALMPIPHHEEGSQDYFVIDCKKEFSFEPENIIMMRLILRQPSPHWLRFDIEDLAFYLPTQDKTVLSKLPKSLEDEENHAINTIQYEDESEETNQYDMDHQSLFSNVRKMVTLAKDKTVKSALQESASGRFDIDGKYDLNLLSYT